MQFGCSQNDAQDQKKHPKVYDVNNGAMSIAR